MGTRETSISRKRKMGHGGGMNVCLFVMRGGEVMKWCQMEVCVYIRKKGMGKVYDRGKQAKKKGGTDGCDCRGKQGNFQKIQKGSWGEIGQKKMVQGGETKGELGCCFPGERERCTGRKKEAGIDRDNGTTTDRQTNEFDDKPAEKKKE
jgi:hypothetical protein